MKLFSLLSLSLSVFSKKYIIEVKSKDIILDLDVEIRLVDRISIGNSLNFLIVQSNNEYKIMSLLNEYNVLSIEEDQKVFLDNQKTNFVIQKPDYTENFIVINEDLNKEIEIDKAFYLQSNPTWGLDRIDQRSKSLNQKYYYSLRRGENVDVYVVDTGIDISHPQFEGRASWGLNTVDSQNTDCNGHGTHVAGTIGSKMYGVAKKSNLIAVKVLNCEGSGSYSGILKGLDFVASKRKNCKNPAVVNMSLGGGRSDALNKAVKALYNLNVPIVVAAGNENQDSCNTSPGSAQEAITVGAIDRNTNFAGFSNWGRCVDIIAPGVDIVSTYLDKKIKNLSGTSMASPHVAGMVALLLAENPTMNPEAIDKFLKSKCTKDIVGKISSSTKNCLLYSIF